MPNTTDAPTTPPRAASPQLPQDVREARAEALSALIRMQNGDVNAVAEAHATINTSIARRLFFDEDDASNCD